MEKRELVPGDVLQISPDKDAFAGMLCVVTEPQSFGCQGYLMHYADFQAARVIPSMKAFVRLKFEDVEYVGRLTWMPVEEKE